MGNGPRALRHLSDEELVVAYQRGDWGTYDEIYGRYRDRVTRVCLRMLERPQDAEEATQETFLKAYQALARFNGSYQLGAWLSRIAANVCLDQLRSRSRSARSVTLGSDDVIEESDLGPEELLTGGDERIDDVIAQIQPLHARALKLRAVEGLSHDEMARHLAMTPSQVKALLHRARVSFRRAWQKAEGWALAPILAMQSRFSRSQTNPDTGSSLLSAGPSFAPYFAERIAATAVAVAVALSGLPTAPFTPDAPRSSTRVKHQRVAPLAEATKDDVASKSSNPAAMVKLAAAEKALDEVVGKLIESAEEQLNDNESNEEFRDRERRQSPLPREARPVERKVQETVDTLPIPPDPLI